MKTCPLCSTAFPNRQSNCPTDGAVLIESAGGTLIHSELCPVHRSFVRDERA
jgi:hypothetical protein